MCTLANICWKISKTNRNHHRKNSHAFYFIQCNKFFNQLFIRIIKYKASAYTLIKNEIIFNFCSLITQLYFFNGAQQTIERTVSFLTTLDRPIKIFLSLCDEMHEVIMIHHIFLFSIIENGWKHIVGGLSFNVITHIQLLWKVIRFLRSFVHFKV